MKRRNFLTLSIKSAMAAGYTRIIPASLLLSHTSHAAIAGAGLSDPALQPLFKILAPNAMAAAFKYVPKRNKIDIYAAQTRQMTGLVGEDGLTPVPTTVWGYGPKPDAVSWPGMTLERHVNDKPLTVKWKNKLINPRTEKPLPHLLPVDNSLHWAYGLPGYEKNNIKRDGVPLVAHVHGGKNDSDFDGNPEYFFSPDEEVVGPRFVSTKNEYGGRNWNDVAGMMWYHDHSLGITRLNVYAGLAGFFPLRDDYDTGKAGNPLDLPADPYELGFAVQDRMFRNSGELFYPAFPGEPFYDDFIEPGMLPEDIFPGGGPTALAEFFGDHMLVNGVIWPKYEVERRQYRVRLLNGTDSRFMRLRLKVVSAGETDPALSDTSLAFFIVGSDQSLRENVARAREVDFMPGERLDLIINFKKVPFGSRVIIENLYGDAPFGGDLPGPGDVFPDRRTDRVMAFDVNRELDKSIPDTKIRNGDSLAMASAYTLKHMPEIRTRKLALFEGTDEFGRLQPLLGTAEPVEDVEGNTVNGSLPWHLPITENPGVGDTEIWEIYNDTGDAHPVHVHLVHFEVLDRQRFRARSVVQPTLQHNGTTGSGFRLKNIRKVGKVKLPDKSEQTRRDMVMALPGQVTRIKMTFTKPGRYVWHCHILSHEDHEMMRPFHVGKLPRGDHDHD